MLIQEEPSAPTPPTLHPPTEAEDMVDIQNQYPTPPIYPIEYYLHTAVCTTYRLS
jgi:hypothetical protein